MNAASLMAVSTTEGSSAGAGAQSVRPASAGSRTQTASGKNSFSDTFDALQKKADAETSKTNARSSAAGRTQGSNASAAADDAPSQDTQDVTAKAPKTAAQPQKEQGGQKSAPADAADAASAPQAAAAALAAALMDAPAAGANEGLDDALAEILERYGLTAAQLADAKQSLLQQVPAEWLKNRNFLLALSGEPLAQAGEETSAAAAEVPAGLQTAALSGQLRALMNADMLRTAESLPAVAAENAEILAQATTEGLIENTERQLAQNAQQAAAQGPQNAADALAAGTIQNVVKGTPVVQEIAAPVVQAQQPAQGQKTADLVGDALTEDSVETPSPLDILARRTMRHDAQGQGTAQQEQQSAEQQLPFMRSDENAAAPLPRSAEPAPQNPQPVTPSTGPAPVQEAASADAAPAAQPQRPQPDYEIPRQIVEQARLLRTLTDTQMVIRLKPEHLGELTLRVAVGSDGAVQASFHSDNAHVRNVIENSLVQLRQELNNQGLKVDRVGVYTGLADGQMPQGQGREAWQQSESGRRDTRVYARGDADDYLDEMDGLPAAAAAEPGGVMTADGVDYRV